MPLVGGNWAHISTLSQLKPYPYSVEHLKIKGLTYQHYLYGLAHMIGDQLAVVETGVRTGVSTEILLEAMSALDGVLWSCDPMYASQEEAGRACGLSPAHPKWLFSGLTSRDALPFVTGGVDMFVHDSDHSYENMEWELEYMESTYLPEVIVVDDPLWGCDNRYPTSEPSHTALHEFLEKHGERFDWFYCENAQAGVELGTAFLIVKEML